MKEILFTSQSSSPEVFIKLGEKCPTKCNGCFYGTIGSNEYEKSEVIASILKGLQCTENYFTFFLYGVDTISNNHIWEYLETIYSFWREAVLQIDDAQIFQKEYITKLLEIAQKYRGVSFLLSKNINSEAEIQVYFSVMRLLSKLQVTRVRYDMTLDYSRFSPYLEEHNGVEVSENTKYFNHAFSYADMHGSITDLVVKNPAQGKLSWCKFTKCILPDFYKVLEDVIEVKDMIEIDIQWNFRIHHPICFLSDIKISHISRGKNQILQDFKLAQKYFWTRYKGNMEDACYRCIQKGYSYNES